MLISISDKMVFILYFGTEMPVFFVGNVDIFEEIAFKGFVGL